jgi:hypothetical protein
VIRDDDCFARQRDYWAQIREAACIALGTREVGHSLPAARIREEHAGLPYRYADREGRVHECRTIAHLAAVTRAERRWSGATWPEDR